MCFSVINLHSYENVKTKWYPEIQHHKPDTPIILVGLKKDLRDSGGADTAKMKRQTNYGKLYQTQGFALASEIGAVKYIECSALTQENLCEIFQEATSAVLNHRRASHESTKKEKKMSYFVMSKPIDKVYHFFKKCTCSLFICFYENR